MTVRELYQEIGGDYDDFVTRIPKESLLSKFVRQYVSGDEFARMIAAYEAGDYKGVFDASHSLKGMAANLSLNKIRETISAICEATRMGDPVNDISQLIETAKQDHEKLSSLVDKLD